MMFHSTLTQSLVLIKHQFWCTIWQLLCEAGFSNWRSVHSQLSRCFDALQVKRLSADAAHTSTASDRATNRVSELQRCLDDATAERDDLTAQLRAAQHEAAAATAGQRRAETERDRALTDKKVC